jgi:hypothetical protein
MQLVQRSEVMGLADYETIREPFRARIIAEKRTRRISVGDRVTVLFENHDTVLLQIQEMLRTERISREGAIGHEIQTYNQLVPGKDELSVTLMIEINDPAERDRFLAAARGFEKHVAVVVDGERVNATWDPQIEGEESTPAVQYMKFPIGPKAATHLRTAGKDARVEILIDHAAYSARVPVPPTALASLAEDLAE